MKKIISWIASRFFPYKTMDISLEELSQTDIIDLAQMQQASAEDQQKFRDEAQEIVMAAVVARIAASLSDEKREEYFRIFSSNPTNNEKVDFLTSEVPNFEEILIDETLIFKYALWGEREKHKTEMR